MHKKFEAFTLIELLVVIAIVGVLSGFTFVSMNNGLNAGKDTKREADVGNISKSLLAWQANNSASSFPISTTACNITGVTNPCPSQVTQALGTALAKLPDDPNGTSYTYQSNGNGDCIITAILSNGESYTYSCGIGFEKHSAVAGACGAAATSYAYGDTTFSGTMCSAGSGVTTPASPSFPSQGSSTTWTCGGSNGGAESGTCTATRTNSPIDGACGTAATSYAYDASAFSGTMCSAGSGITTPASPSFPSQGGSTTWTCGGANGGNSSGTCTATRASAPVAGACGTAATSYTYDASTFSGTMCSAGSGVTTPASPSFPAQGGSTTWTCGGSNGGAESGTCTATRASAPFSDPIINGSFDGTGTGWTLSGGSSKTVADTAPYAGSYDALVNYTYDCTKGEIYQNILVPNVSGTVNLQFYERTGMSAWSGVYGVQINNNWVFSVDWPDRRNTTTGWALHVIDISAYKGQTIKLGIVINETGRNGCGNGDHAGWIRVDEMRLTNP
jgi:prepilin-type N-terminal cleavage/methylation domain-containing protein